MPSSDSGTWEAVEPVDDDDSDEVVDESVAVQSRPNLTGYIEPQEEYILPKKQMSESKLALDQSLMSLYFISQLNIDAEPEGTVSRSLTDL